MNQHKKLNIYIDESGNISSYEETNPFYSVSFVLVFEDDDNAKPIQKFKTNLHNLNAGNHFVHTGNLVRGEKPYVNMLREDRWKLFYALYLFAQFAHFSVAVSTTIKGDSEEKTLELIAKSIQQMVDEKLLPYKENDIVLHYDFGQDPLTGIIAATFLSRFTKCRIEKTTQSQEPFMQISDLYACAELLRFKVKKGYLSKSEAKFFGGLRNLKKIYLNILDNKYL